MRKRAAQKWPIKIALYNQWLYSVLVYKYMQRKARENALLGADLKDRDLAACGCENGRPSCKITVNAYACVMSRQLGYEGYRYIRINSLHFR